MRLFLITLLSTLWSSQFLAAQELSLDCAEPHEILDPQQLTLQDLPEEERKAVILELLRTGDCEYEGIKLHGKVQFVQSFPDIKIQYVNAFEDIRVKFVNSFPDDCGEWQKVTSFPDFKVQVVTSFPDIKVREVDSFPGMR